MLISSLIGPLVFVPARVALAAVITAPPLLPRQTDQTSLPSDFIGWTLESGSYASWTCQKNSIWQTIGSYGRCCSTAGCFMATNCRSNSIMVNGDDSTTCSGSSSQRQCVTGTVFHSIGDQKPIMNYQCWPQWDGGNWSATIATTTAESTLATSTATSTVTSSEASSGSVASTTRPLPTSTSPTSLEGLPQNQTQTKESKAWIAGPVLGGILGAILFTFLGIFLYKRHLRRLASQSNWLPMDTTAKGPGERYAYVTGGQDEFIGTVEAADGQLHEADSGKPKSAHDPVELPAKAMSGVPR